MRKKVIILLALISIGVASLWLWPSPRYDLSRVHPSLRDLDAPYQSVFTSYFSDGGSIGVRIVDRDGRLTAFALPIGAGTGHTYPKLFVGAAHASDTNAVEIPFTEDTRRMLISVIDAHRSAADSSDLALAYLRGMPRDHARIWAHAAVNLCKRVVQ